VRYRDKIVYGGTPVPSEAMRWFFDFYPFRSNADSAFLLEGFRHISTHVPAARPKPPTMATGVLSRSDRLAGGVCGQDGAVAGPERYRRHPRLA
jgi:hypothetical protein